MSATTESNTPKLDAILAKMPKEVLPIWTIYFQSGPHRDKTTDGIWKNHCLLLSYLLNNRAASISTLSSTVTTSDFRDFASSEFLSLGAKLTTCQAALEISRSLRILVFLELEVVALRVKVKTLEAERSLGDDASRRLEEEIRETSQTVQRFEKSVEIMERIALEKATNLGLV
ncbi:MAG: hypothetical protein Q9226_004848 [Calogaya cf. arnoldii]